MSGNKVGLQLPNGPGEYDEALGIGVGVYLVMEGTGVAFQQALAIRQRHPGARVLMRRPGGYTSNPDDVINDLRVWYPAFAAMGIVDWIPWNEADRLEEGGATPRQVAELGAAVAPRARAACPGIRLHWPAAAHEPFYAQIGQWRDAAALYDCLDGHWYVEAEGIDRLGSFFAAHFPGTPWYVTEYSSRGRLSPPPRGGVFADALEACRKARLWQTCEGIVFFTWLWPGGEVGGVHDPNDPEGSPGEEIYYDRETRRALVQAVAESAPEPIPLEPFPPAPEPERTPMLTAMYLHQFGGPGRNYREQSYREFAQTARAYGIRQVWMKAFQGGHYATWDPSPLGLNGLGRIQRCYAEMAEEGVEAVFWGVPQGNTWQVDATICKSIAQVAGNTIHIDQENFREFWNAPAYGTKGWVPFYQTLKDDGLIVDVSAVGRFGEVEITPWPEIIDNIDTVWLQSYWTDFGALAAGPRAAALTAGRDPSFVFARPDLALAIADHFKDQPRALTATGPLGISATGVVADDINALLAVGVPIEKMGSIFPHNGSRENMDLARGVLDTLGVARVAIWVWDYAGLVPFEFLRDVAGSAPTPIDNRQEHWAGINAAAARLWDISQVGVLELPDGTDLRDERAVLAMIDDLLGAIDRHRIALAGG